VVSGKPLETFLQDEIFEPLGMVDTAFYVPPDKLVRFSEMYGSGGWVIGLNHGHDYTRPPGWPSGGGGLVSTMADYLRFCKMLVNGGEFNGTRLLGRKTIDVMRMNHTPTHLFPLAISNPMYGYGFGLGFCVMLDVALSGRLTSVGEYGWSGAAGTHFWIDPAEDIIAIFMTQTFFRDEAWNPVDHREYRVDLRTLVYQALE
jgi:CubicO group peptidase (beta-lactamase class C family)